MVLLGPEPLNRGGGGIFQKDPPLPQAGRREELSSKIKVTGPGRQKQRQEKRGRRLPLTTHFAKGMEECRPYSYPGCRTGDYLKVWVRGINDLNFLLSKAP